MYALIAVLIADWNGNSPIKTVHLIFEDFEEMVKYTDSEDAKNYAAYICHEHGAQSVGWDYEKTS